MKAYWQDRVAFKSLAINQPSPVNCDPPVFRMSSLSWAIHCIKNPEKYTQKKKGS